MRYSLDHLRLLISFTAAIERVLNLNHDVRQDNDAFPEAAAGNATAPKSGPVLDADGNPVWKVLVFDTLGRDVISSVLRVNDLRAWGVTIHLYGPNQWCPR